MDDTDDAKCDGCDVMEARVATIKRKTMVKTVPIGNVVVMATM